MHTNNSSDKTITTLIDECTRADTLRLHSQNSYFNEVVFICNISNNPFVNLSKRLR